jgi:hypothetical protein
MKHIEIRKGAGNLFRTAWNGAFAGPTVAVERGSFNSPYISLEE